MKTDIMIFTLVAVLNAMGVSHAQSPAGSLVPVTVDNFTRAESDMYFGGSVKTAGLGKFHHFREPTPLDKQDVIRMNRDTLAVGLRPRCWAGDDHTAQCGPAFHIVAGDR
jgi:hypothetical protein